MQKDYYWLNKYERLAETYERLVFEHQELKRQYDNQGQTLFVLLRDGFEKSVGIIPRSRQKDKNV